MKILVQKFGGTSLATREAREKAASRVIAAREEGYVPVVVVSAIGREGEPYATDTLLGFVRGIFNDIPRRELDLLMSCGETISGVMMAATLESMGIKSVFLTGPQSGIITDNNFGEARIIKVQPQVVIKHAKEGSVVIVAGFQGVTESGEVTTLGRGGSDTTAAALGVALNAVCVDIYTDVDGIMTADPRIVEDAVPLQAITYDEICHLAYEGAKVIHPRAIEIVSQKAIPLRVRSAFSDGEGTLVTSGSELAGDAVNITRDRIITGIAQVSGIYQFKVTISRNEPEQQRRLFKELALAGISIDFINILADFVLFTVKEEVSEKTGEILDNKGFIFELIPGCAKVSCVGAAMTGIPGVIANIAEALARDNIRILQCNDSHTTVWVLVKKEDMEKAINALHRQFLPAG